jgi:hypothetical protein
MVAFSIPILMPIDSAQQVGKNEFQKFSTFILGEQTGSFRKI